MIPSDAVDDDDSQNGFITKWMMKIAITMCADDGAKKYYAMEKWIDQFNDEVMLRANEWLNIWLNVDHHDHHKTNCILHTPKIIAF